MKDIPFRPAVSSWGTVTYKVTKELARVLEPLVGNYPHHIKNTKDFVDQIHNIQLQKGQCISTYDVTVFLHQCQ